MLKSKTTNIKPIMFHIDRSHCYATMLQYTVHWWLILYLTKLNSFWWWIYASAPVYEITYCAVMTASKNEGEKAFYHNYKAIGIITYATIHSLLCLLATVLPCKSFNDHFFLQTYHNIIVVFTSANFPFYLLINFTVSTVTVFVNFCKALLT